MTTAHFRRGFWSVVLRSAWIATAFPSSQAAQAGDPARAWDFELAPGTYSVEIEHALHGVAPGSPNATYTITLGDETQSQAHALIVDRPFVPLHLSLHDPRHLHVLISGISASALQRTSVRVLSNHSVGAQAGSACASCKSNGARGQDLIPANIQQQLALPEGQIDIGIAALTFAKEIYPDIDIQAYSSKIDALADKVRVLARWTDDPERRIRVLNTVLFRNEGFHYDRSPFSRSVQKYYFLNGILDSKQGICYTMPLLYIAVAQRVGYPIYPVLAPDHMFVRYVDASFKEQNIETTSGGKYFPDEAYIEHFSVSSRGLESGSYMRTLTYREFLGHLLAANALVFAQDGRGERALAYQEKATEFDAKFADFYDSLRALYFAQSGSSKGEFAAKAQQKAKRYAAKAKDLGFVDPANIRINREEDVRGTS